jgi:hypothetical protein
VACQESQKVCVGSGESGVLPSGYPCLNDQQCESSQCRSTGRLCKAGTTYSGYPCSQDSDCCTPDTSCPAGACFSPATGPTPTGTATSLRTATPSRTGAAATPTPSPSVRASVTATAAASPAAQIHLATSIGATDTTLAVDNASSLPNSGTVLIDSERIVYSGKSGNQLTGLTRGANGTTAASHSANALVTLVIPRPPATQPLPLEWEAIGEGAGCATAGDGGWSFTVLAGVVVLWAVRRRPGARQLLG